MSSRPTYNTWWRYEIWEKRQFITLNLLDDYEKRYHSVLFLHPGVYWILGKEFKNSIPPMLAAVFFSFQFQGYYSCHVAYSALYSSRGYFKCQLYWRKSIASIHFKLMSLMMMDNFISESVNRLLNFGFLLLLLGDSLFDCRLKVDAALKDRNVLLIIGKCFCSSKFCYHDTFPPSLYLVMKTFLACRPKRRHSIAQETWNFGISQSHNASFVP